MLLELILGIAMVLAPLSFLLIRKWPIRVRLLFVAVSALFVLCAYFVISDFLASEQSYWIIYQACFTGSTIFLCFVLILFSWLYDIYQTRHSKRVNKQTN